jgi:amino acid transporter
MTSPNLIRWGGLAALLAGAFYIVEAAAAPFLENYHWAFHTLDAPAHALLAVGVVGLYLWQRRQEPFEWLGTVGVILIVTASVLITLGGLAIVYIDGVLRANEEALNDIVHPLEYLVLIGAVLFSMATMRVNTLPSRGALLIIIGALGFFGIAFVGVGPEWLRAVAVAILGAGWAWLGYALWSEIGGSAQQPKRVR